MDPTLDGRYKRLEEREDSLHLLSDVCGSESGSRLALFPRSRSNPMRGRAKADKANATGTRAKGRMRRLGDRSGDNKENIRIQRDVEAGDMLSAGPDCTKASNKLGRDVVDVNNPRKGGEAMPKTNLNTSMCVNVLR